MSERDRFRTNVTLAVSAYAVLFGVLVYAVGDGLLTQVPNLGPQVSWLMSDTTALRVGALKAAGRPETAALYALSAAVSWSLICALAATGFVWGVLNKGAMTLGLDKAIGYATAIAGLYALSTATEVLLHSVQLDMTRGGIHAIPALWFASMIPSAAILSRIAALVAHDVGALIAIAIDGEPARLAELVSTAEDKRGVKSIEARVARRLAAWRPLA
ncbi:hypothetical protein [Methylopila sp. M107]|uniref:hypothetical protein n=1 Tax=Methylopila sp. M107 TaxID=1101190 RepID=UPI0003623CB8|nr:hypothetical protein [Methylopila sp. M107]